MIVSKIGRRGQITIPGVIRRRLRLEDGDRVAFVRRDNEVVLQPLAHTLLDMKGSVPVSEPQDFADIRQQVRESRSKYRI